MPHSQFDSPAILRPDGSVQVTGSFTVTPPVQDVEFRFMIVQNDEVAEGTGRGQGNSGRWSGETDRGQGRLEEGSALAIGLALLARTEPGRGYETLTWSGQIELKRQGGQGHNHRDDD
jgi:hypothetical protein